VLVDEGHRSQNSENNIRMLQTLPKAAFVAFTGTPLLKDDKTEITTLIVCHYILCSLKCSKNVS
jgi:type I site-specific restriction-modification system R (restriction) subunit